MFKYDYLLDGDNHIEKYKKKTIVWVRISSFSPNIVYSFKHIINPLHVDSDVMFIAVFWKEVARFGLAAPTGAETCFFMLNRGGSWVFIFLAVFGEVC